MIPWGPYAGRGLCPSKGMSGAVKFSHGWGPRFDYPWWLSPDLGESHPLFSFVWTLKWTQVPENSMLYQCLYMLHVVSPFTFSLKLKFKFTIQVLDQATDLGMVSNQWNSNVLCEATPLAHRMGDIPDVKPGSWTPRGHCAWRAEWEPAVADAHRRRDDEQMGSFSTCLSSNVARWKLPKRNSALVRWENQRTQWWIVKQATVQKNRMVNPIWSILRIISRNNILRIDDLRWNRDFVDLVDGFCNRLGFHWLIYSAKTGLVNGT